MHSEIEKYSFGRKHKELDLISYIESLENYNQKLPSAIKLENEISIFIDTNVLLRYYEISFFKRESLYGFFMKHENSIIITNQIQKEFVKNRENVISGFFNETLKTLNKSYKESVTNSMQEYYNKNKKLFDDLPGFDEKMQKLLGDADKLQGILSSEIKKLDKKIDSAKNEDRLLSLVRKMQILNILSEADINFLKTEFDTLKKNIDTNNIKNEATKPQTAFPGLGDILKKPKDPYGDYILFHEMLSHIKAIKKDAIFLTYDSTKHDWLNADKEPYSHYIQIVYLASGQSLFIVDAERFFDTYLQEHFNSLVGKIDYYSPKSDYEKEYILEFVGFERIIRVISQFIVLDNFESASLSTLIQQFIERGYLTTSFMLEFRTLLHFRNILLHEVDRSRIESLSEEHLQNLLQRLKKAVSELKDLYSTL